MTNGRQKGKRGELEWAHYLMAHGFQARRGQQFCGSPDSPDVVCEAMPDLHAEVKRVEAFSLYPAMHKAREDAGHRVPYVAHRKSREEWVVIMDADNWIDLVRRAYGPTPPPNLIRR